MKNSVHIMYTSGSRNGKVARLKWAEADDLVDTGKATYISNKLYRLAQLGADITSIPKKEIGNDKTLQTRINKLREGSKKSKEPVSK